ncbi:MAG: M20/M25/M40 family metallo-hydrolase [Actinobacteria bacterium]|nr:M20/M25/M40 family metallo-hydrolase [Actinomycetota bacterium]
MSDVVELLRGLVEIDSINPDLIPGAPGEAELARYVAAWCARAGLDVEIEEAAPRRPNVIATARGSGEGRALLLNAHMDTVGVETMEAPFDARLEGGRLYGRGSYDMKGSLAAIMTVAAEAKRRGLRGDVVVAAVADEEVASIGTEALVASGRRFDAAVVAEPPELDVAIAHKGFVGFEIETRGRAAHGSRPDLGEDAIARMGPVLVALDELATDLVSKPTHRLLGSGSVHASLIEGGQEFSSYPERCLLTGERRTVPGESLEDVERELGAIAGDAQRRLGVSRHPFEAGEDEEIVQLVHGHAGTNLIGVPFWTDAALVAASGVPTVVFGPHGEGAHAAVEWVDLASVERCVEVLLAVAVDFCG